MRTNVLVVVGLTVLVYDILISLDQECSCIWKRNDQMHWLVKLAYVMNRYGTTGVVMLYLSRDTHSVH